MLFGSGTGLVLENYISAFKGYGLISSVLTGISGNVGAILISRISTSLHASTFATSSHTRTAITLWFISTPMLWLFLAFAVSTDQVNFNAMFAVLYFLVVPIVLAICLVSAYAMSVGLWKAGYDPDLHALPLFSSLMDGMSFLYIFRR